MLSADKSEFPFDKWAKFTATQEEVKKKTHRDVSDDVVVRGPVGDQELHALELDPGGRWSDVLLTHDDGGH